MISLSYEIGSRYELGALLTRRGLVREPFVELGVDLGEFAGNFLAGWTGQVYYAVDAYEPYRDQPHDRSLIEQIARAKLRRFELRIKWCKEDTVVWLRKQPSNSLCGGYVDAGHEYWEVHEEMRELWRCVRPGGIVGGHDFAPMHPPVVNAVKELIAEWGVDAYLTIDPHINWSWYTIKV
jgi:methyltransferase family protein